jgi:lipoprotein-releasing system permease protein
LGMDVLNSILFSLVNIQEADATCSIRIARALCGAIKVVPFACDFPRQWIFTRMFRPLELFIGLRYTRAKRRNHFISFISLVSMLGIAVGVTALIAVISVMNGFEKELTDRILGMVSHATISGMNGGIPNWQQTIDKVSANPHVRGAAPYVERQALLSGHRRGGAIVRGVLPEQEPKVSELGNKMLKGKLDDLKAGSFNIVLGNELAMELGVGVGDKVNMFSDDVNITPVGAIPRSRRFEVVGIFSVGFQEYDEGLAVIHLDDAERLFQLDGPTGIRLKLDDMFRAWDIARDLTQDLGSYYRIQTWRDGHTNFFSAVRMEKLVMFIILSLIIAVAAFNLVSTLIMLVTDKQADIAILRTLGISPNSVMGIFMVQGVIVGSFGILIGIIGGVLLALNIPALVKWIESTFHVAFLSPDVYYISDVPSDLHWSDVGWIALIAWVFCLIATIYPARRAARTQPAAALRYE